MLRNFLKNEKGGAMLMAIMGLAIISIFTMAAIFMGITNAKQTQREGKRTQAYYVADAGAKTIVDHLNGLDGKEAKNMLIDMKDKTKNGEEIKGTYEDWEFDIEVTDESENKKDKKEDKYEIKATGEVNGVKDWTIAEVTFNDGGGYNIGDGQIFVNSDEQIDLAKVPQLKGEGLSIYTKGKKTMEKENPIFINDIQDLFLSLNTRISNSGGSTVRDLNEQEKKNYRLEILETSAGKPKDDLEINKNNSVKSDKLVKYNVKGKNEDFKEITFKYDTNKSDILNYFSKNNLKTEKMVDTEIEKGLKSTFLLPIETKEQYYDYLKKGELFPLGKYKNPTGYYIKKAEIVIEGNPNKNNYIPEELDLTKDKTIQIDGISVNNSGKLEIKASDNTKIFINGDIKTDDSKPKMNKIDIIADGQVNFHIKGTVDFDGEITVSGKDAEVNFYLHEDKFQINNNAKIKGINLYAPNSVVDLGNNINYEGIIVAKKFAMNDNATFRAPTSGPASTDSEEPDLLEVEWKR